MSTVNVITKQCTTTHNYP